MAPAGRLGSTGCPQCPCTLTYFHAVSTMFCDAMHCRINTNGKWSETRPDVLTHNNVTVSRRKCTKTAGKSKETCKKDHVSERCVEHVIRRSVIRGICLKNILGGFLRNIFLDKNTCGTGFDIYSWERRSCKGSRIEQEGMCRLQWRWLRKVLLGFCPFEIYFWKKAP